MDLDGSLDHIIEYDPQLSSDKENESHRNSSKVPKTTIEQFDRISKFMCEHNAELLDKCTFDSLWNDLAAKLNDIGPPEHTTAEWKRIWSVHKYNRKKRRIAEIDNQETEQDDRLAASNPVNTPRKKIAKSDLHESTSTTQSVEFEQHLEALVSVQSELCNKIDTVIENQASMIANQESVIRELRVSNRLLKDIAKKS